MRLATAAVAAVEQHDPVFELETGKLRFHRLLPVGVQIEPSIGHIGRANRLRGHRKPRPAAVNGTRLGTLQAEHASHRPFVAHFHKICAPSVLDQSRRRSSTVHRNPAFWIDANGHQTARIQDPLDLLDSLCCHPACWRPRNPLPLSITERLAQIRHGFNQPADLRDQGLCFNRREQPFPERVGASQESENRTEKAPAGQRNVYRVR